MGLPPPKRPFNQLKKPPEVTSSGTGGLEASSLAASRRGAGGCESDGRGAESARRLSRCGWPSGRKIGRSLARSPAVGAGEPADSQLWAERRTSSGGRMFRRGFSTLPATGAVTGRAAGASGATKGNISPIGAAFAFTGSGRGGGATGAGLGATKAVTGGTGAGGGAACGAGSLTAGAPTDVSPVNGFLYSLRGRMTSMELGW